MIFKEDIEKIWNTVKSYAIQTGTESILRAVSLGMYKYKWVILL